MSISRTASTQTKKNGTGLFIFLGSVLIAGIFFLIWAMNAYYGYHFFSPKINLTQLDGHLILRDIFNDDNHMPLLDLKNGQTDNRYQQKFGFHFHVCTTGQYIIYDAKTDVFDSDDRFSPKLVLLNPVTNQETVIFTAKYNNVNPYDNFTWSTDCSKIYFTVGYWERWENKTDIGSQTTQGRDNYSNKEKLYEYNLTTSRLQLIGEFDPICNLKISPDNNSFVYQKNEDKNNLYLMDIATKTSHRLTDGSYNASTPSWSPNGEQIVFSQKIGEFEDREICVIQKNGEGLTCLTQDYQEQAYPVYSPNGQYIAFLQGPSPYQTVLVMQADGKKLTPLSPKFEHVVSENYLNWVKLPQ